MPLDLEKETTLEDLHAIMMEFHQGQMTQMQHEQQLTDVKRAYLVRGFALGSAFAVFVSLAFRS